MSEFITNSDPTKVHDFKPGHIQAPVSYHREACNRLHTLVCDMQEEDAQVNGGSGSETWMVLADVAASLLAGRAIEAHIIARENGLYLPGLREAADFEREEAWGDKADRAMMEYPHQN